MRVLALLMLLAVAAVHAEDELSGIEFCKEFSVMTRSAAEQRRDDVLMSEVLPDLLTEFGNLLEEYEIESYMTETEYEEYLQTAELNLVNMVIEMYNLPPITDDINDFENAAFGVCYRSLLAGAAEAQ